MAHKVFYLAFIIFQLYRPSIQDSCNDALGLEDGRIPDGHLSASSQINAHWHGKNYVRLNGKKGSGVWCAKKSFGQYFQVYLSAKHAITGISIRGRNSTWPQYIKTYYIAYGFDGKTYFNYTDYQGKTEIFKGNNDLFGVKFNSLSPPILAQYLRLYAVTWIRNICMQMELYGCSAKNCSINNGGCSENCIQVDGIQIKCSCFKSGYKIVDGLCKDIDECHENKPCAQNCNNIDGSYKCSCRSGYNLGVDGASCNDINECYSGNHSCHQVCVNEPGSYSCICSPGYEFGPDKKTCVDIDECARHTSGCEQQCANSKGSFQCSCNPGYRLARDQRSCNDVDECAEGKPCEQICINNVGNYTCKCRAGYLLSKDGHMCDDIDECSAGTSGCSHQCVNNRGSFYCTCPKGYKLNLYGKICKDVDECQSNNGNCLHICYNNKGSYRCSCNAGYKLKSDNHGCEDINECTEKKPCDLTSTVCTNTEPYYRCDCKSGFQRIDASSCERVQCSALPTSSKFTVLPPRCLKSDTNRFGENCTFACAKGYEPVDKSKMVVTCLYNRQWSSGSPQCKGVQCPVLGNPSNGHVFPSECSSGIRYPYSCHIRCNSGYRNTGPSSVTCQIDGSFSVAKLSDLGCRKDIITPVISCPPGITADLPKGRNAMIVSDRWKNAYANVGTITCSHDENVEFPHGITTVTFTVRTKDGQTDSCSIRVTILDKEPPTVLYCPTNTYVLITSTSRMVNWPKAQFKDNVGLVSVSTNRKSGILPVGVFPILFTAKDAAGNTKTCQFKVIVAAKVCSIADFTVGSGIKKSCSGVPGFGSFCSVACDAGNIFLKQPEHWYTCTADGIWEPKDKLPVPDCVGYSAFKEECPAGTVQLVASSGQKVCANCPSGTYYNSGKCVECQIGFYQDQEKQLSCLKCPAGKGTEKPGGKQCKRLCPRGTYSVTGLPGGIHGCTLCAAASYQSDFGMKSCINCPNDTSTLSAGKISKHDCGRVGVVTVQSSSKVAIMVDNEVTLSCKSTALPWMTIQWKKTNPVPDGFGGKVTQTDIVENGRFVGKTYKITKATIHDKGIYMCETVNQFGIAQASLYLDVLKNLPK